MTHSRQDHLDMIRTPDNWPRWPILPLKNPGRDYQSQMGYLYGDPPSLRSMTPITVHIGNIYAITPQDPQIDYPSIDAMLDDGWIVD